MNLGNNENAVFKNALVLYTKISALTYPVKREMIRETASACGWPREKTMAMHEIILSRGVLPMDPVVTVLIPAYNAGAYLREALSSVFAQTYPYWQMILVDDASSDNSLSSVRPYLADSRVTLVNNLVNRGQSRSLNRGLELVKTPYTVQLDADDWFYPYTLDVLVRTAEELPERVAVVSGNLNMVFEDENGNTTGNVIWKNRSYDDRYDFLLCNNSLWPRFYRTAALRQIGGWPTDDPFEGRYMEDRILLYLIEEHSFHWIDTLLYNHRRHGGNLTNQLRNYNKIIEWAVRDALKRWGDYYEPVFSDPRENLKKVIKLLPKGEGNQGIKTRCTP
jgi:glycosyltransferase involved in cell wall biosynthesis